MTILFVNDYFNNIHGAKLNLRLIKNLFFLTYHISFIRVSQGQIHIDVQIIQVHGYFFNLFIY